MFVQVKVAPAVEEDVLAALVDVSGSQAAIEQGRKAGRDEVLSTAAIAEIATGRPAAFGEVLCAQGDICAAVEYQVKRVADDRPLGRGSTEVGYQHPAFPGLSAYRVGDVGQVENGHAKQGEITILRSCLPIIHTDHGGMDSPVRIRQEA